MSVILKTLEKSYLLKFSIISIMIIIIIISMTTIVSTESVCHQHYQHSTCHDDHQHYIRTWSLSLYNYNKSHWSDPSLFYVTVSRRVILPMLTRELVPHLKDETEMKVCVDIISDLLVTLNRTDVVCLLFVCSTFRKTKIGLHF